MKLHTFVMLLTSVLVFSGTVKASENLPVFVTTDWVNEHDEEIFLFDMSEKLSYQKFHLPNATWLDYSWLIKPQDGLQLSGGPSHMRQILSRLGVTAEDTIIIYDDIGGLEASRLYWELTMLRHKRVAIMDGGSVAWALDGKRVTQEINQPKRASYKTNSPYLVDRYLADKQEVITAIDNPNLVLVDTRTELEYVGSHKEKRSGHIPSAVLFPWDATLDPKNGFKQRSDQELMGYFKSLGMHEKDKTYILYCNTAHRAARLWSAMRSLGYENVKMYDASMQEWAQDNTLPLKIGSTP